MRPAEVTRPAVFLDRDGTLMEEANYCGDPLKVRVFDGVKEALARLRSHGFLLAIVTNQSGLGRGYFTETQYHSVHAELLRQLSPATIDAAYFCGDHPDTPSARRKPSPEMIFEAQREHKIDLGTSFLVGDKAIDLECGRAAGVRTVLVQTGYGLGEVSRLADHVVNDLAEAADWILDHARK